MAFSSEELQGQTLTGENEAQNASAVASTLIPATDVFKYGKFSVQLENNESGGGETVTAIVWLSQTEVPGAVAHTGAADWSQLGSDITLAPGDREIYTWTTLGRHVAVTIVATGAITSKVTGRIMGRPF